MKNEERSQIPAPAKARGSGQSASSGSNSPPKKPHRNYPLCHTSKYCPPGSSVVGLSKDNQPSKVVWEVPYGLSKTQFELLSTRFPGVAFVQVGFDAHDHPIAHTSYKIVWENVMKQLQPGWKVADVSGNPSYNQNFNRRQVDGKRNKPINIDTFCKVISVKDSVRAKTRWGPMVAEGKTRWEEMTVYDMYRNEENIERFAKYDCFLMNHVLYYYTMGEITQLLNMNKNSVLMATIHKLPDQAGSINCGEQKYEKDFVTGRVRQWNVDTGEEYVHPDPAPWFKKFCYADRNGAIAWTINKGCDDTYRVTVTSTEPRLVPEDCWLDGRIIFRNDLEEVVVNMPSRSEDPPPAYPVEAVKFKTHDILPNSIINKEIAIPITHPKVYETLTAFMINKPRTHRTLQDLTAKAHREVGNNTLVGSRTKIDITTPQLTSLIFAAWMTGVRMEDDLFKIVASEGSVNAVNRNLSGRTMNIGAGNYAKQAFKYALTISNIARSKDPVHHVLAQIDELL